jgi:hypothetical protein
MAYTTAFVVLYDDTLDLNAPDQFKATDFEYGIACYCTTADALLPWLGKSIPEISIALTINETAEEQRRMGFKPSTTWDAPKCTCSCARNGQAFINVAGQSRRLAVTACLRCHAITPRRYRNDQYGAFMSREPEFTEARWQKQEFSYTSTVYSCKHSQRARQALYAQCPGGIDVPYRPEMVRPFPRILALTEGVPEAAVITPTVVAAHDSVRVCLRDLATMPDAHFTTQEPTPRACTHVLRYLCFTLMSPFEERHSWLVRRIKEATLVVPQSFNLDIGGGLCFTVPVRVASESKNRVRITVPDTAQHAVVTLHPFSVMLSNTISGIGATYIPCDAPVISNTHEDADA